MNDRKIEPIRSPYPMLPTQREKVVAHAGHVLDLFCALRGRFAMLEPMLFDQNVVRRFGDGSRGHGMNLLTGALLDTCVLAIAKIAYDGDDRSPSLRGLDAALRNEQLCHQLREAYAVWHLHFDGAHEPETIAFMEASERRDEELRRIQFDTFLAEFRDRCEQLQNSSTLASFKQMRDQLISHNQLTFDGTTYQPLDVTTLGLKLGDLRVAIEEIERIVNLATLICRSSSYDFEILQRQFVKDRDAFWSPTSE